MCPQVSNIIFLCMLKYHNDDGNMWGYVHEFSHAGYQQSDSKIIAQQQLGQHLNPEVPWSLFV
jgi:hypothetical protein